MQLPKINSIQTLRAIAVLLVVYDHTLMENAQSGQAHFFYLSTWGAIGVDLFFIISGFIMTTILPKYIDGTISSKDFILKRAIRILPLYWLISLCLIFLSRNNPNISHATIIKTLTIFPIFDKKIFEFALIPQSWTLAYELYFYIIIFIILIGFKKNVIRSVLITLSLIAILGCFIDYGYLINFLTSPLLFEFAFGIIIGLVYRYLSVTSLPPQKNMLIKRLAVTCFLLGMLLMILTIFTGTNNLYLAQDIARDNFLAFQRVFVWGVPCFLFLSGYVIMELFYNFKTPKFLILIGDASYSCYLLHFLFLRKLSSILSRYIILNHDLSIVFYLVIVVLLSLLVYKFVERPLIRFCTFLILKKSG